MAAVRNSPTPVSQPETDTAHDPGSDRPADEGVGRARILVVGDGPLVAESVPASLRFVGYEAVVARSGAEAVALSQRLRPDLVVLDMRLPDVDGLTLARGIRHWHHLVVERELGNSGPVEEPAQHHDRLPIAAQ